MTESERARLWRVRSDLSVEKLAEMTGYSPEAIYLFERGITAERPGRKPKKINAFVWQRYKMACAGAQTQLGSGKGFSW